MAPSRTSRNGGLVGVGSPASFHHDARRDGNGGGGNGGRGGSRGDGDRSDCDDGKGKGNSSNRFRRHRGPRRCGDNNEDYTMGKMQGTSSPDKTVSAAPAARFSPLAAGFIGALLSFVTVSAIVWGTYFFVHRRRARTQRAKAAHPAPHEVDALACQRTLTPVPLMAAHLQSSRVTSPMPYFASARDAAAQEKAAEAFNPFVHPQDPRGVDPFAEPYEWKPSNAHPSHTLSA